ncbi:hypothetical protein [Croceicoccus sp. YJ47]|nr:hypothetical protein [Croceicoccus sp. YJ47]
MGKTTPSREFDENPEWTHADFERARKAAEVLPKHVIAAFRKPRA